MSGPRERQILVNGHACRVLENGEGDKVGYLAGLIGLPRWTPFLDELSKTRRVIVPSLPGFPGATGHEDLDHLLDWLAASLDLLDGAGLAGEDLVGSSVGALMAAEIAAISPGSVKRLVLMAPLGLYDEAAPIPHLWAKRSGELNAELCLDQTALETLLAAPEEADPVDWNVQTSRASAAGARLLWPMCDLGLAKRLHRIQQSTLILWGEDDAILPSHPYADLFAAGVAGPARVETIAAAGHLIDLDQPVRAAAAIERFLQEKRALQPA
jgi:pimeloyl-ACP methyl ester carboxylesterase